MKWLLVVIVLTSKGPVSFQHGPEYTKLTDCMVSRELVVETFKRPIVNYQAICVAKDFSRE